MLLASILPLQSRCSLFGLFLFFNFNFVVFMEVIFFPLRSLAVQESVFLRTYLYRRYLHFTSPKVSPCSRFWLKCPLRCFVDHHTTTQHNLDTTDTFFELKTFQTQTKVTLLGQNRREVSERNTAGVFRSPNTTDLPISVRSQIKCNKQSSRLSIGWN